MNPAAAQPADPRPRAIAWTVALLAVGVLLIFSFATPVLHWRRQLIYGGVAVLVAAIPTVRETALGLLAKWRTPSPATRRWVAIFVAALAAIYLLATALYQERDFFPRFHDEHAYMLQAQMLARGRLWMPQHELADFFETFHIFVKPVYAPIYFPGAALMHVPAVWLALPYWVM